MKRVILFALAIATAACGDLTRQGTASSYLIVSSLQGASGATPNELGGSVFSDVITVVDDVPTVFNDIGQVEFQLGLKNAGPTGNPNTPTTNNAITVNRYRVRFIRSDGRNTPGMDVPYGFDGAFTVTVLDKASAGFNLVRNQAKREAPLSALLDGGHISTIAEVTFYGFDQTGREVSATAQISVNFGNFGDPKQ